MLIVNGTVHPIDAPDIPNGFVDVREGKIWRVGFMEQCPSDWEGEVLDANQGHILPGFIDAHCHLGMFGDSLGFEGDHEDILWSHDLVDRLLEDYEFLLPYYLYMLSLEGDRDPRN